MAVEGTLAFPGVPGTHQAVCRDVSLGGMFLLTDARASFGSKARFITSPGASGAPLTFELTVRWTGSDGIGVQFVSLGPAQREAISTWTGRHAAIARAPARRTWPIAVSAAAILLAAGGAAAWWFLGTPAITGLPKPPPRPGTSLPAASPPASSAPTAVSSFNPPASALQPAASQPPPASASAPASAPSPPSSPAPAVSSPPLSSVPPGEVAPCAAEYFPQTFGPDDSVSFLCEEGDLRKVVASFDTLLQRGPGKQSAAYREWSKLDWYELAVVAIVRRKCCVSPAAVKLPQDAACDPLPPALERVAAAFFGSGDMELAQLSFEKSAVCLHLHHAPGFPYKAAPYSGGHLAFESFVRAYRK